jgi:hypothetical protein
VRELDEAVSVEGDETVDEWAELDKLRGEKWPREVLRRRRELVDRAARSKALVEDVSQIAKRDRLKLARFDEQLRPRMMRRRARLRSLFGATYKTEDGQITFNDVRKVLDYDKNREKEILEELKRRHVRKAIRIVEEIDDDALKSMSPRFIRSLASFGVTVGRMFYVGVKSTGEKNSTNLLRFRRNKK